jgi:steroid delta-isomerase-like uncharacterized protein
MATETTRSDTAAVAAAYFEAIAERDLEAMTALWEPGALDVLHGMAELTVPGEFRKWFGDLFAAFPDWRFEVLDQVTEGDRSAVRWRATATFTGPGRFEGLVPTGAAIDISGFDLVTVRDGKIHRNDAYVNATDLAQQLGAMPPPGSGQERAMIGAANLKTRVTALLRRG